MNLPKRSLEGSFIKGLKAATVVDAWGVDPSYAGGLNITNILLSHKDLLVSELHAITSRLTWLAFTPKEWPKLKGYQRVDQILSIISSTTNLERSKAVEIAVTLNEILSNVQESRTSFSLAQSELLELLDKSQRRCYICGREFSEEQVLAFLDRHPYQASSDRNLVDKWKPIYSMRSGWCIDIDHCIPISSSGTNQIENLNLCCHYCNLIKRDWISIFDIGISSFEDIKTLKFRFHALRLITGSQCYECNCTVREKELTVACHSELALPTIQNFFVTCYRHDPQSKDRFSKTSKSFNSPSE